jgi:hypothetical protein
MRVVQKVSRAGRPDVGLPRCRGYVLPPVPGRRLHSVVVLTCCVCGGGHVHRVGDVDRLRAGHVVKRCPSTREKYQIGPAVWRNTARIISPITLPADVQQAAA